MREPVKRTRWMALTLIAACVGSLLNVAPSAHTGYDGGPSLVLAHADAVAALPAASWLVVAEGGDASSAWGDDPPRHRPARSVPSGGLRLAGPSAPDVRLHRAAFLLGLHAAPANAPPLS